MSIQLEEFFIKFGVDAKPLLDAISGINQNTEQTKVKLEQLNTSVSKVSTGFRNFAASIVKAAAAYVSYRTVISGITESYQYALQLGQASEALGVNIETLDAWGRAVERNGGSAQALQTSVASLSHHLNITNQQAISLLPRLADTFSKVRGQRAVDFGRTIGLDQSVVLFLQQGRREVEAMINRQKELGVVTKQDAEIARNFNRAWHDTGFAFRSMWLSIATTVLPIIQSISEKFTEMAIYFRKHSDFIKGALIAIGIAVGIAAAPFVVMNAGVILVTTGITALIGLFGLLYEDFQVFKRGGESAIGLFLQKWPQLNTLFSITLSLLEKIAMIWDFLHPKDIGGIAGFAISVLNSYKNLTGATGAGALETNNFFNSMGSSAISNTTSNSFSNSYGSNSSSISTGNITINAPTREGLGIANALDREVFSKYDLKHTTNAFVDGRIA